MRSSRSTTRDGSSRCPGALRAPTPRAPDPPAALPSPDDARRFVPRPPPHAHPVPHDAALQQLDAALVPYADAVVDVLRVSAQTGDGMDELRALLTDRWTVLTGHSGVGKSSLTNALLPDADLRTGAVGPRGGRHTTVASLALPLPEGGWLVDTPGVRSFGLGMLDRRGVAAGFPELAGLDCGLDDCGHDGEPGCALPAATLHPVRRVAFERLAAAVEGRGSDDARVSEA